MNIVQITRTLAVGLALVLTATGLWATGAEEDATAAADKEYVTDPVTGKVVVAPEYGGTLTFADRGDGFGSHDQYHGHALSNSSLIIEKLGVADWAIDRKRYPFVGGYQLPVYATRGALAESWDQPDPTTYVFHIRQGVHWHDKPPMNGRELTAKDIEYNFHRHLGLGQRLHRTFPLLRTVARNVALGVDRGHRRMDGCHEAEGAHPSWPGHHLGRVLCYTAPRSHRGHQRLLKCQRARFRTGGTWLAPGPTW